MARFLKLEVVYFSNDFYAETGSTIDKKHLRAIEKSDFHFININNIDEIVPGERTVRIDGVDTKIDATYFVFRHEGAMSENNYHPDDRDAFLIVDGDASDWVTKIERMIAADIAGHHPEPEQEQEQETKPVKPTEQQGE